MVIDVMQFSGKFNKIVSWHFPQGLVGHYQIIYVDTLALLAHK